MSHIGANASTTAPCSIRLIGWGRPSNVRVPLRAVIRRPGSHGLPMHGDGIIHKKFNPHCSKAHRSWSTGAVSGFFMGKEEPGTVNGEPCDGSIKCHNSSAPNAF
jgi:hypothetical protein